MALLGIAVRRIRPMLLVVGRMLVIVRGLGILQRLGNLYAYIEYQASSEWVVSRSLLIPWLSCSVEVVGFVGKRDLTDQVGLERREAMSKSCDGGSLEIEWVLFVEKA